MKLLQINKNKFGKRLLRNTFAYYKAKRDKHRCKYDLKLATKPTTKRNDSLVAITNCTFGEVIALTKKKSNLG